VTPTSAAQALAAATASLVPNDDVTDTLTRLLSDCAQVLGAGAAGLMVTDGQAVQLLNATSHRADELELYQIQQDNGPCIEIMQKGGMISLDTPEQIRARWPDVGSAITAAGFNGVHATAVRWEPQILGGLNVFDRTPHYGPDRDALAQAFADIVALVLVSGGPVGPEKLILRVREALTGRTLIEQAKGILAHQHGIDMAEAYQRLIDHRRRPADNRHPGRHGHHRRCLAAELSQSLAGWDARPPAVAPGRDSPGPVLDRDPCPSSFPGSRPRAWPTTTCTASWPTCTRPGTAQCWTAVRTPSMRTPSGCSRWRGSSSGGSGGSRPPTRPGPAPDGRARPRSGRSTLSRPTRPTSMQPARRRSSTFR